MRGDGWQRIDARFNGYTRQKDGLTVFASDGEGRTRAFVRSMMPLRPALREIAAELDALGPDWKVDCISTPATIWRDLREQRTGLSPETTMLTQIGRLDLRREA